MWCDVPQKYIQSFICVLSFCYCSNYLYYFSLVFYCFSRCEALSADKSNVGTVHKTLFCVWTKDNFVSAYCNKLIPWRLPRLHIVSQRYWRKAYVMVSILFALYLVYKLKNKTAILAIVLFIPVLSRRIVKKTTNLLLFLLNQRELDQTYFVFLSH